MASAGGELVRKLFPTDEMRIEALATFLGTSAELAYYVGLMAVDSGTTLPKKVGYSVGICAQAMVFLHKEQPWDGIVGTMDITDFDDEERKFCLVVQVLNEIREKHYGHVKL